MAQEKPQTDIYAPQKRYHEKYLVRKSFNLNRRTDADIIAHLETVGSFQTYVKQLIRRDMRNPVMDDSYNPAIEAFLNSKTGE